MKSPTELVVVLPIYNEEANLETVVREWVQEFNRLGIGFEFLAVNDGSTDGSGTALQKLAECYPGVVTPVAKKNGGHGRACRTGYTLAVERGPQWVFQIDSDGQCDPQFFPLFWSIRDQADCLFGTRKTRDDGFLRVLISGACRLATLLVSGMYLQDANVPYRLMRAHVLREALTHIPEDFNMQNVALTLTLKRNASLRWKHIPIHFRERQGGSKSIHFKNILAMGWELVCNLHQIRR